MGTRLREASRSASSPQSPRGGLAFDCPHIRHGNMRHDLSSPELRYEVEVSNRLTKFQLWIEANSLAETHLPR
jgi:hypothetical protein